uniref:Homeobox domain-containing protein n=1 Tax=Nothoprocta perdicaria TaxID=30464 RepID=A0A8C6ZAV3_NOTPE
MSSANFCSFPWNTTQRVQGHPLPLLQSHRSLTRKDNWLLPKDSTQLWSCVLSCNTGHVPRGTGPGSPCLCWDLLADFPREGLVWPHFLLPCRGEAGGRAPPGPRAWLTRFLLPPGAGERPWAPGQPPPAAAEAESGEEAGGRARRLRTAFSAEQISTLESSFQRHQYLVLPSSLLISPVLSLQIKTWFQNRRMKLKRQLQELRPEPFCSPPLPYGPQGALVPLPLAYAARLQPERPGRDERARGKEARAPSGKGTSLRAGGTRLQVPLLPVQAGAGLQRGLTGSPIPRFVLNGGQGCAREGANGPLA